MLFQTLAQSPVFRGLTSDELEKIFELRTYKIKKFSKGEIIALREDRIDYLMIVIKGSAKGEMLDMSGKTIKIEDIMAPYPLASAFIFGQRNQFPVDVTANDNVEIFYLSKSDLLDLFHENKILLMNFLNSISNRSQFLAQKLMFLNFNTIKKKLANYILKLAAPDKSEITFPKTQSELSQYFGVTRPSFARSLKELETGGMIKINRKQITIIDKSKLIQMLQM